MLERRSDTEIKRMMQNPIQLKKMLHDTYGAKETTEFIEAMKKHGMTLDENFTYNGVMIDYFIFDAEKEKR